MRAGRLRHYVTIQQDGNSANNYGEQESTWSTWKKWHIGITPLTGREYILAQQTTATVTHKVEMRYCEGLSPKTHRFLHDDGTVYEINAVLGDKRKNEMTVMVTEVAD